MQRTRTEESIFAKIFVAEERGNMLYVGCFMAIV